MLWIHQISEDNLGTVGRCWRKHDLHDISFGEPKHAISEDCVLVISLLESHIKHDPIAEIASLGCTVVEQERLYGCGTGKRQNRISRSG